MQLHRWDLGALSRCQENGPKLAFVDQLLHSPPDFGLVLPFGQLKGQSGAGQCRGDGDPQNLVVEIRGRWVHLLSQLGAPGAPLVFWGGTTLKSPEIVIFLPFSLRNNIGSVFLMFDLKDPKPFVLIRARFIFPTENIHPI